MPTSIQGAARPNPGIEKTTPNPIAKETSKKTGAFADHLKGAQNLKPGKPNAPGYQKPVQPKMPVEK